MKVKIIGDTGRPTLWAGRVVDLDDDEAARLIEEGFAVPVIRAVEATERRAGPAVNRPARLTPGGQSGC